MPLVMAEATTTTSTVPPPDAFEGSAARKLDQTPLEVPELRLTEAERRRSYRAEAAIAGWISGPVGQSQTTGRHVTLRDLSLHGAGFTSDRAYRIGADHWIMVNRGPMRLSTRIRIASCTPRDDGNFDVGGEFY
ncbi:MAG: PilZ domain-containing protein [Planctomycetota bacterium]